MFKLTGIPTLGVKANRRWCEMASRGQEAAGAASAGNHTPCTSGKGSQTEGAPVTNGETQRPLPPQVCLL